MRAKFINEEMTSNDIKLIDDANKMSYTDWMVVSKMAEKADTEEAKEELLWISRRMSRREERDADTL